MRVLRFYFAEVGGEPVDVMAETGREPGANVADLFDVVVGCSRDIAVHFHLLPPYLWGRLRGKGDDSAHVGFRQRGEISNYLID